MQNHNQGYIYSVIKKLKDFFIAIAEGELAVERQRQRLAQNIEFDLFSSFKRIDRNCDGLIDSCDLKTFMHENQRNQYQNKDCALVIKYFDIDGDNALNYQEFVQMILPCDNLFLRSEVSQRPVGHNIKEYENGERVFISFTVERNISDFFEREIEFHLTLEQIKQQLHSLFSWNTHEAFDLIDQQRIGFLNYQNIQQFLRQNGELATDEQVIAIVRRMDADADQVVRFQEFCEMITPQHIGIVNNEYSLQTVIEKQKRSSFQGARQSQNSSFISRNSVSYKRNNSPLRSKSSQKKIRSTKLKKSVAGTDFSEGKSVRFSDGEPGLHSSSNEHRILKTQPILVTRRVNNIQQYIQNQRSAHELSFKNSPQRIYAGDSPLRQTIQQSVQSSKIRQYGRNGSPLRSESPTNKFKNSVSKYLGPRGMNITDLNNKYRNFIDQDQPEQDYVLNHKNHVTRQLIQRSEIKKERMKYADPNDHYFNYDDRFIRRNSYNSPPQRREEHQIKKKLLPKVEKLDVENSDELITVLIDIIKHERELEEAKIRLVQQEDFNLMDGFQMIDLLGKGWVTAPQLQESLQEHGLFTHKDDIYTFVRRYDQDSDGRFVYSDFCDAFTPRIPYYSNLLAFRHADFLHRHNLPKYNYFSNETRNIFLKCFRVHFEIEESIELIKKRLARRPKFDFGNAFAYLDSLDNGFISIESLRKVLQENQYHMPDDDILKLMHRFDKNKNGRVAYHQFIEEIMPKNSISI